MRAIKFRGKTIGGEWVKGLLATKDDAIFISNSAGRPFAFQIRPETVGQFTGLLDKHEQEIYEGDIVKTNRGIKFLVKWQGAGFKFTQVDGSKCWSTSSSQYVEIIGNIHDDPNLLSYGIK